MPGLMSDPCLRRLSAWASVLAWPGPGRVAADDVRFRHILDARGGRLDASSSQPTGPPASGLWPGHERIERLMARVVVGGEAAMSELDSSERSRQAGNLERDALMRRRRKRTLNGPEMLRILDSIARDRKVERSVLVADLEQAMVSAARKHFGSLDLEEFACSVDQLSGEISLTRH